MGVNKLDCIVITVPAYLTELILPKDLKLKDLSLEYEGRPDIGTLFTGVYGTSSKQALLEATSTWTRNASRKDGGGRALLVDVSYKVDNFKLTREQGHEGVVEKAGWIHMERLTSAFRESIRETWVQWIRDDHGAARANQIEREGTSLVDIAVDYPQYVARMMRTNRAIKVIVHPVRLTVDPTVTAWVATVRYDRERLENAQVRFLPQIPVRI